MATTTKIKTTMTKVTMNATLIVSMKSRPKSRPQSRPKLPLSAQETQIGVKMRKMNLPSMTKTVAATLNASV
jgi:hypothetical protein